MTKEQFFITIGLIFILTVPIKAQFIDDYGIKAGIGFSNQKWEVKTSKIGVSRDWKNNYTGFAFYFNAQKNFNKYLTLKAEIGYVRKGFNEGIRLMYKEYELWKTDTIYGNVILNNFSSNIGLKIKPFSFKMNPYISIGIGGDYLIDYKDFKNDRIKEDVDVFKSIIDEFNKFSLNGLIGFGIEYKELAYLEFNYYPALSKTRNDSEYIVINRYFEISVGFYINNLLKK